MYDFKAKRVEHLRRGLAVVPNEVPQRGMYRKVGNEKRALNLAFDILGRQFQ